MPEYYGPGPLLRLIFSLNTLYKVESLFISGFSMSCIKFEFVDFYLVQRLEFGGSGVKT